MIDRFSIFNAALKTTAVAANLDSLKSSSNSFKLLSVVRNVITNVDTHIFSRCFDGDWKNVGLNFGTKYVATGARCLHYNEK